MHGFIGTAGEYKKIAAISDLVDSSLEVA